MKDWISKTKQIASLSDYPKISRRTGCIIVERNKVIAVGWNQTKNRMRVTVKSLFGLELKPTDHAEMMALNSIEFAKGCDMFIFRINGGVSRPCDECLPKILAAQLRSITFTNRRGEIERIVLRDYDVTADKE